MNARERAVQAINQADGPARYDGKFALEALEAAGLAVCDPDEHLAEIAKVGSEEYVRGRDEGWEAGALGL